MSPSEAIVKVWWSITAWPSRLKRAASMRSPSAKPTQVEIPWPSGPVVASIPAAWPYSGWPAHGEPTWRKFSRSFSVRP